MRKPPNKNCLSYWFPLIRDAGLPVPKTEIVTMDDFAAQEIHEAFYGKPYGKHGAKFFAELCESIGTIGLPCFLRTGQLSGKHRWSKSCYYDGTDDLEQHVFQLFECSELAGIMGLPWDVWVVRELLPTKPLALLPMYGGMPLCREFRFFVQDGEIVCRHPYWPEMAIRDGFPFAPDANYESDEIERELPENFAQFVKASSEATQEEWFVIEELAHRVSAAVPGYWSVDLLDTESGWHVTDMALGNDSWHWPGCENSK